MTAFDANRRLVARCLRARFTSGLIAVTTAVLVLLTVGVVAAPLASANGYGVKRFGDVEQKVLFVLAPDVTNEETLNESRRKADVFRQILSSYWLLNVHTIEAPKYVPGLIGEYDVVVVIDEYFEMLPEPLSADLLNASGKRIVHFGITGAHLITDITGVPTTIFDKPVPLSSALYKETLLDKGQAAPQIDFTFDPNAPVASGVTMDIPLTATDLQNVAYPAAAHLTTDYSSGAPSDYLVFPYAIPDYYDPQSYTNAVLDLLHIPFGDVPGHPRQALIRLEDVNAYTYSRRRNSFFDAVDALKQRGAPFHIAYIQRYVNPGEDIDTTAANHRHFEHYLEKAIAEDGAVLVQHGYTHQHGAGVSALDFEFADEDLDRPVPADQAGYAHTEKETRRIVTDARAGMEANGLPVPDIWESPHYRVGRTADKVLRALYPIRYEPPRGIGSFPFPVLIDGVVYVPENLGYIHDNWPLAYQEFQKKLKQLQVFRNATPSFFWHPWRDTHEIEALADLLRGQGYTFVTAYDLLRDPTLSSGYLAHQDVRKQFDGNGSYHLVNAGVVALYVLLLWGVCRYFYDSHRFRKYFRLTRRWRRTLDEVAEQYEGAGRALPTVAIFVPARNEGLVIANTVANLAGLDYPKDRYQIIVITDERELDDDVDVLTRDVVWQQASALNRRFRCELVKLVEVPAYYSGAYGDESWTYAKSTKGRALNYALQEFRNTSRRRTDFIGVLDADGRLNKHILKELATQSLETGAKVLQGPVFQVSNLSKVSTIGVMAGLELGRFHLVSMMPRLIRGNKVQFLAGTNYFIDPELLHHVGGWDQDALVEDAELALRLYVECRVTARALSLPEIEQTPASVKIYNKQRERWSRGHFDLLKPVLRADIPLMVKLTFVRKVLMSIYGLALDLGLPVVAVLFLVMGWLKEVDQWMQILSIVTIACLVLMWDAYGQTYSRLVVYSDQPGTRRNRALMRVRLFLFMPVFMFIQLVPRVRAFYRYVTRRQVAWAKTERTAEVPAELVTTTGRHRAAD